MNHNMKVSNVELNLFKSKENLVSRSESSARLKKNNVFNQIVQRVTVYTQFGGIQFPGVWLNLRTK